MELEEVKSHYRNKITEMEAAAKKQERKGNNNLRKTFYPLPFSPRSKRNVQHLINFSSTSLSWYLFGRQWLNCKLEEM